MAYNQLPPEVLDAILLHLSIPERAQAALVCQHWDSVLRSSPSLWVHTTLYLDKLDEDAVPDVARWLKHRAKGIQELELHFSDPCWWASIAFMVGVLGASLRKLGLCGIDTASNNLEWLGALSGLQSLDLSECLGIFHPCLARLSGLQELVITHASDKTVSYTVPQAFSRLTALTRLELRHGLCELPAGLGCCAALRLLTLEGVDLYASAEALNSQLAALTGLEELGLDNSELAEVPPAISALTRLTCLALPGCFSSRPWTRQAWEQRLQVLSTLSSLEYLDLSDNNLSEVPCVVARLPRLSTLKLQLNPLIDGLAEGPYPSLRHLDLHGTSILDLPGCLSSAQQLTFLGLSCCHSLTLDRSLVERVLGRLQGLESLSLCGSMVESVDAARALLTLGRLLPHVEVHSKDELEEEEDEHHHDVADAHGNVYTDEDDSDEDDDLGSSEDEEGEGEETDASSGEDEEESDEEGGGEGSEEDTDSDDSSVLNWDI